MVVGDLEAGLRDDASGGAGFEAGWGAGCEPRGYLCWTPATPAAVKLETTAANDFRNKTLPNMQLTSSTIQTKSLTLT